MANPTTIRVPHDLGAAEAKRRMHARIGELAQHLPAGVGDVRTSWPGEDRMAIEATAMGQRVTATIDVEERALVVAMRLPALLSFMSGAIAAAVERKGTALLLAEPKGNE